MRKSGLIALLTFCALVFLASPLTAQLSDYNHPEAKWMSFETEHFVIHYVEGLEDVAALGAKVAEEIHEPLCTLYDYRPDTKVALLFTDHDDIANAASYFQSNKIHFYSTSMAWDFRGTHNWLRNVVTHEYTHMIQLGASRKWTRSIPAIYGQFLGYEEERRPDVLYGYPNRLISWPLPSVTVPAWFAEGTAQYQFTGSGYDYWDAHRDMLLRQATLSGRLLSFEQMGYFGKSSLESEGVYNQGYAFVRYITDQTGDPKILQQISATLANPLPVSVDAAIRRATGKRGQDWYREWKASLERNYTALKTSLALSLTEADTLPVQGFVNLYPRLSPDGKKIAFISNQNRDYFGQSSLYIYNLESQKAELVAPAVQGGLSWLPDGTGILFARQHVERGSGSNQYDLYLYRLEKKKVTRLSRGFRAESVDVSPDGKTLVFTINEGGRREFAFAPLPDLNGKVKPLTRDDILYRHPSLPHEQHYLPRWSPDGRMIAVARHLEDGRGIRVFDVQDDRKGVSLRKEFDGENLELRDPSWTPDGSGLLVAWDVSGISNIYRLNLEFGNRDQLTSVLGGAYYPHLIANRLVYSDFCENGFRICTLPEPHPIRDLNASLDTVAVANSGDGSAVLARTPYQERVPQTKFELSAPRREANPYKPSFEKLYWFPRVAFDYGTFKPGTYLLLNDVLEKLSFLGGFAINQKRDYDLFGMVEYRALYPTLFAEYYNIQRRLTAHFADSTRIIGEDPQVNPIYDTYRIRYRYSLNEIIGGVRVPFGGGTYARLAAVYDRYNAHNRFDDEVSIGITYFKGWAGKLGLYTDQRRPGISSEINPSGGFKGYAELTRANHLFYTDLEVGGDAVGLQEIYKPYNYTMVEGGLERYFKLPGWDHTMELRGRGGYIGERVDPFFYLYAGGLPGMRGYSFYSLGGEKIGVATASYRFPIVRRADVNLWPLSVNRIYGTVFADFGNAWGGNIYRLNSTTEKDERLKKDIGAGLRMQLHSFYSYPTAVSFDVAYGFDKFTVSEEGSTPTNYGGELRYYLTVLFDFYSPFAGRGPGKTRFGF